MFLRVPLADDGERLGGEVAAVIEIGFDKDVVVGAEAVDVMPGAGGVEGEFVGGDADDGAWVLRVGCQFVVYPLLSFTPSLSLFLFSSREKKGRKTIFFVQLEHFVRLAAGKEALAVREVGKGCGPWSWEPRKWVLVSIAVDGSKCVDGGLRSWISCIAYSNKYTEQPRQKGRIIGHTQRTVRRANLANVMMARRFCCEGMPMIDIFASY